MIPLIKVHWRQLRNMARRAGARKYILFLSLGASILGVMTWFFMRVFGFLHRQPEFPPEFKLFISEKILMMAFLTMFMMLTLSALSATLNTFFLSRDLSILLSSPLPTRTVFAWKSLETAASSSLMAVFFSLPVLFSFAWYFAPGVWEALALAPPFFFYTGCGLATGALLGLIIPSMISVRKLQPVLSVISILFISAIVILLRMLRPEKFSSPDAITDMLRYMQGMNDGGMSWFPFAWAAGAMKNIAAGEYAGYWGYTGVLAAVCLTLIFFVAIIQKHFYLRLYDKLGRGGGGAFKSQWKRSRFFRGAFAPFWKKEIKTFRRSPELWSQLLIIIAIIIVFILNIRGIPAPHPSVKNLIAFLNMGMAAMITAGLNSRFAFPALPLENPGMVHVLSSPCSRKSLFHFKFLFFMIPGALIGLGLFLTGDYTLGAGSFSRWSGLVFLAPLLPFLTVLSLFYGARINSGVPLTPQHLLLSRDGIFYMLWSLVWVFASMLYMARPMAVYYFQHFLNVKNPVLEISLWFGGFVLINLVFALVLYKRGLNRFMQNEFFY